MELYSAYDLSASGIAYSIVNAEVEFNDEGELSGYTEVIDENYVPGAGEKVVWDNLEHRWVVINPAPEHETLCNTLELLDDHDRWAHERDAHISARVKEAHSAMVRRGDTDLDYGAMKYASVQRERRISELVRYMKRLALQARKRPQWVRKQARALHRGVRARWAASVDLIVKRGRDEWWLLYLTKEQTAYIERCVRRLLSLAK